MLTKPIIQNIVVIDDDLRVIKSIKMAFDDYDVVGFQDGEEALEYIKTCRHLELVLVDVVMPKIDGITVLNQIKAICPEVIVFIMTGYGTMDVAIQALRNHADDFLEKPFDVKVLREKVDKIFEEKSKAIVGVSKSAYQFERIRKFILKGDKKVTLNTLSEEFSLNPKYISRLFNRKSGAKLREFKLKLKIDTAKKLLAETDVTASEISEKLGYQNVESFLRIFKRVVGCTPKEYRATLYKNGCSPKKTSRS